MNFIVKLNLLLFLSLISTISYTFAKENHQHVDKSGLKWEDLESKNEKTTDQKDKIIEIKNKINSRRKTFFLN